MIPNPQVDQIDRIFESFDPRITPGCALGVMKDGKLIYAQGYGCANLDHKIPIAPDTIFPVASMSKQFTAFALALLIARGQLSLDDDIRSILPEVPDFGERISLRHLVHHTSGLRGDLMLLLSAGWRLEDVIKNEDVFYLIQHQQELNFPPGEKFSYCGSGYLLLALAIERITGLSLHQFCSCEIFESLNMTNTRFMEDPLELIPGRADAYYPAGSDHYRKAVLTSSLTGGTGLFTTVKDLTKWDWNFISGRVGGREVLDMILQRGKLSDGSSIPYAFGLIWDSHKGHEVLVHGGDGAGVHSYMIRFPGEDFTVAVLGNCRSINARKMARSVADLYVEDRSNSTKSVLPVPDTIELSPKKIEDKTGRYFNPQSLAFIDLESSDGFLSLWGNRLLPVSETRFLFASSPEASVEFLSAGDAQAEQVLVDTGMGAVCYERSEPVLDARVNLEDYCGAYFSEELNVTWHVVLKGEELAVQRFKQGESILQPVVRDVFTDSFLDNLLHAPSRPFTLMFVRSEDNFVNGLLASDGSASVSRMRFSKRVVKKRKT